MRKRPCPWLENHEPQLKCHVSEKDITKRSSVAMDAVYNKTLTKLFNGAKNASNNNLSQSTNSVIKEPDNSLQYSHEILNTTENDRPDKVSSDGIDPIILPKAPGPKSNAASKFPTIFHTEFSTNQKTNHAAPVCVSCVRFSSTAAALNPAIVTSCQLCSSCLGSTCQLCINPCKGCNSIICGNCSIDIESVNGYKAEMFIVCLGCRDRFDTESNCTMDTG